MQGGGGAASHIQLEPESNGQWQAVPQLDYRALHEPQKEVFETVLLRQGVPKEGKRRARHVPGIQMNVPAIDHNALPPDITPSSSPGTLSTSTLYDCWRSNNFPFFRPTNGTITCTLPL